MQNFCICIIYKMVKKIYKKRAPARKGVRKGGRRLGGPGSGPRKGYKLGQPVRNVGRLSSNLYNSLKEKITGRRVVTRPFAQRNFNNRVQQSDNITNAPVFKIGVSKKLGFQDKVLRINNPPVIFKRQYSFSSEVSSGRKGFFGIPINKLNSSVVTGTTADLYSDIMSQAARFTTDTAASDPTVYTAGQINNKFYIDYLSEKLQMVNSGSNSLTGKVSLFAYKQNTKSTFTNVSVPMTPINLMMLASTNNLVAYQTATEAVAGNGWTFDTVTSGVNYTANYDMPGSVLNTGGATAQTDLDLQPMSRHIKEFMSYYFSLVKEFSFSLKPGQQLNHWTIFNDLPDVLREAQDMTYLKGISFYLVVEFQAGVVGDATVTTGDNVISTGSGQLSCIVEEKRIVGYRGRQQNGKLVMITAPLAGIAKSAQYIINPDTGVADTGYDEDA